MVRWACWSPLSSTDPNIIDQIWKIPAMYYCVKCVYSCVIVSCMVGFYGKLRFETSWKMFTQRGGVCYSADIYR